MDLSSVTSFIHSLYPDKNPVVLHEPQFLGNERKYIMECIDSTFVSSVGAYVGRFEKEMAEFLMTADDGPQTAEGNSLTAVSRQPSAVQCVAAVNGTAALHLALQAAGVKPGDKVITQPLTFIATANAIKYAGAEPIFIDVDRDTLGLSPDALETYLKKIINRKSSIVSAIVPMHTFGLACRIDEIVEIGNRYGIPVVEDAAESIGTWYKGQHTGTFGLIGTLSFNGNKTITTGGGGMLITTHQSLFTKLKHLSTQAKVPHNWEFRHDEVGYNYRLPNLNAAMGVAQLEMLPRFLEAKRRLHNRYAEFFDGTGIELIHEIPGSTSNYWLNAILLKDRAARNEFLQYTHDHGVHCRPTWELMHTLPMFQHCHRGDLSNAEWIADRLVNLPSSPIIS